jgi:hypothetical protein
MAGVRGQWVRIRFNTKWEESPGGEFKWRVMVGDEERLAKTVTFLVPCRTTQDLLSTGATKWHLSAEGSLTEADGHVTIAPLPSSP